MSFSIKSIFQKGGTDLHHGGGADAGFAAAGPMIAASPFASAEPAAGAQGFGQSLFRTVAQDDSDGQPVAQRSGGSPFSPFSNNESTALTVADLLPQLPPDVARANGAMPDQPVMIAPQALEAAISSG